MPYQMQRAMTAAQKEAIRQQELGRKSAREMQLLQGLVISPLQAGLGRLLQQWQTPEQAANTERMNVQTAGAQAELGEYKRQLAEQRAIENAQAPGMDVLPSGEITRRPGYPSAAGLGGVPTTAPVYPETLGGGAAAAGGAPYGKVPEQPGAQTPGILRDKNFFPGDVPIAPEVAPMPQAQQLRETPIDMLKKRPLVASGTLSGLAEKMSADGKTMGPRARPATALDVRRAAKVRQMQNELSAAVGGDMAGITAAYTAMENAKEKMYKANIDVYKATLEQAAGLKKQDMKSAAERFKASQERAGRRAEGVMNFVKEFAGKGLNGIVGDEKDYYALAPEKVAALDAHANRVADSVEEATGVRPKFFDGRFMFELTTGGKEAGGMDSVKFYDKLSDVPKEMSDEVDQWAASTLVDKNWLPGTSDKAYLENIARMKDVYKNLYGTIPPENKAERTLILQRKMFLDTLEQSVMKNKTRNWAAGPTLPIFQMVTGFEGGFGGGATTEEAR